jgi:type IV secretion system protein VirD4
MPLPLAPNSLLLGWADDSAGRPFGFATGTRPAAPERAVAYCGDGHLITVAPTRAGKGRGAIIPNLLTYPGPIVVFDPKGELYAVTARRRREMGQRVERLDPCEVAGPGGGSLNPLDVVGLEGADLETDAQMLASLVAGGASIAKEPFWDNQATALHSALIAHAAADRPPEERHLGTVRDLIMADDTVYSLAVLLDTRGKSMSRMAYAEIAAFLATTDVTRSGILSTAQAYIKLLLSPRVLASLRPSTFPLADVVAGEPMTIYLILPPDKLRSHKAVLRLWVGTLLKAFMSRRCVPASRTLMVLDECAQLGEFPPLEAAITLCAGYGLQCWTFWQDLAQVQSCYPSGWQTVLNNCAVVQTFGVRNRHMATQWGDFLEQGPERLLALTPERQVVRILGEGEAACRRPDYLTDAALAGLADENPIHAGRPPAAPPAPAVSS